ncbi:MAG: glycosyltransferase family 2 protein [Mariprofundaceae bacterium]
MPKVSVYILTYNEENKIEQAVRSVSWADEIVVADSFSTDKTTDIAKNLGARIVSIPFEGFGKLRNAAVAACSHEWIFSLDADERCTAEAHNEIQLTAGDKDAADAYYMPRRNYFMGRWIRHCGWYPDYRQPQLFRKGAVLYSEADEVHEGFEIRGKVGHLKHAIWQTPFQNLAEVVAKGNRYSTLGAKKLARTGKKGNMMLALMHALGAFLRIYVLKLGFLDGWAGFVISLGNFEGTFYRYAKLTESQRDWNLPPTDQI